MFRLFWRLIGPVRRRPFRCLIVLLLLAAVAASVALHFWAISHFRAAELALDDDSPDDAQGHVEICLAVWPYSASTHLLAARIARVTGDYPRAEAQLSVCKGLQREPSLETHLEALLVRAEKGETDDVENELDHAVDRDAVHARLILESLGRAYLNVMDYRSAVHYLNLCLERYPDDVRALNWRGLTHERLRDLDEAEADYRRALELSHGRADVRLRLAGLYLEAFDPSDAEPHLEVLRKAHPDRPDVQLAWAKCHLLRGQVEEARRLLDSFLAAHPTDWEGLTLRGKVALADAKPGEAEGYFRRALEQERSNPSLYFALYDSLRAQPGRDADAAAALKEHDRVQTDFDRLHQLLAEDVAKSGGSADALAEVGEICLRLGREQMGLYWLLAALKEDPSHKEAHKALADYYEEKGDAEAAKHYRLTNRGGREGTTIPLFP